MKKKFRINMDIIININRRQVALALPRIINIINNNNININITINSATAASERRGCYSDILDASRRITNDLAEAGS
jgi:hypothetical protein